MQLSELLNTSTLNAMYDVANKQSDAELYASNLTASLHEEIFKFAVDSKLKLNPKFWKELSSACASCERVAICAEGKRIAIIECKSVTVAHVLGARLKKGCKIALVNRSKWLLRVDWDSWKFAYALLTSKHVDDGLDEKPSEHEIRCVQMRLRKRDDFYAAASVIRNKKMGKRGYNMTFDELRAQDRLERYERQLRNVTLEAGKIMSVL